MDVSGSIEEFRKDSVFSEFLNDDFNLQQCLSVIKDLSFNEQLEKISFGIEFVKQSISNLTSLNCEEFFQRTSQLDLLYQELQFIQIRAQSLAKTMDSIKSKLEEPYRELTTEISNLAFSQRCCDLLRKMLRIIHLSKRIFETDLKTFRSENDSSVYQRELNKTSQYLNEVNIIIEQENSISGKNQNELYNIVTISNDLKKIEVINNEVLLEADRLIHDGIERSSESTVGTALLVFYNLGVLQQRITSFTKEQLLKSSKIFQLKLNNPKELRLPANNEMLQLRLQESLEDIDRIFRQMLIVFKVLKKKRENFNQKLLIEYLENGEELLLHFWNELIVTLSNQLNRICQEKGRIKILFEENYHQFLVIFIEFHTRILEYDSSIQNGRNARNIIHNFESSYLSSSINGLFEVVNQMFKSAQSSAKVSRNSKKQLYIPTESDIEKLIDKIKTELLLAGCDRSHLLSAVSKNAQQAANLFIVKCEHLSLVDGDASQVIGPITKSQQHNVQLIKCLRYFEITLKNLLLKHVLFEDIQSDFNDIFKNISQLIVTIVEPLMTSLEDALEAIILTMHSENYNLQKMDSSCSLYIRELQSFLNRSWNDYLKCLGGNDDETIQQQVHKLANKTIDMFALNTCLLAPVSSFGRQRIHQDFEAFEKAIEPLCDRTGSQSGSFQMLRALKSIILLPPEMIHKSPTIGNPIPVSLIVTFLISNYGQNEISVQKCLDYSTPRYLKWYQTSSEEQIISKINECLQAYSNRIRKENKTNYLEIYPILVDFMKKS